MRVFMTGATGFIGFRVSKELIAAGHKVLGLSRSEAGDKALVGIGVEPHRGSLEAIESLKRGAAAADAVMHLGFVHDFSKFKEVCEIDRLAIEAIGSVLAGSKRPLIVTSGVAGLGGPGKLATEDMDVPKDYPLPRVSEQTALALISKGVSSAVVRLPQVHDPVKQGLVSYIIPAARANGVSAYVGEGKNRWAAAHVDDVAKLYRLAVEQHEPGVKYHAVAEEGVAMRDIAEAIGQGLKVPVKSVTGDAAAAHFGLMAHFAGADLAASSVLTRKKLGWTPTGPGLIADMHEMDFSKS